MPAEVLFSLPALPYHMRSLHKLTSRHSLILCWLAFCDFLCGTKQWHSFVKRDMRCLLMRKTCAFCLIFSPVGYCQVDQEFKLCAPLIAYPPVLPALRERLGDQRQQVRESCLDLAVKMMTVASPQVRCHCSLFTFFLFFFFFFHEQTLIFCCLVSLFPSFSLSLSLSLSLFPVLFLTSPLLLSCFLPIYLSDIDQPKQESAFSYCSCRIFYTRVYFVRLHSETSAR